MLMKGFNVRELSLVQLGFLMPFEGIVLSCDRDLLTATRERLQDFAAARLIRTAAHLARPLA